LSNHEILITGSGLTVSEVCRIASEGVRVRLAEHVYSNVEKCHRYVQKILDDKRRVYGVTTGFGSLASKSISPSEAVELQRNLVISHSAGVGSPLPKRVVRAAMVLRLNTLVKGYSGVAPRTVELISEFLNRDIVPVVPEHGSLGASGDLAPLAHIALALTGRGNVFYKGRISASNEALKSEGLEPIVLGAKEGLALINGTQVTTAFACLAINEAYRLIEAFESAACLTIEALGANTQTFDKRLHLLRPLPGQIESANTFLEKLGDSSAANRSDRVQEPYSIRCIPQVHGAARDMLRFVEELVSIEINSVTDNPALLPDDDAVLSGGNFHAQPIAMALDSLLIALTPLGILSERRMERLLNAEYSGLPSFLAPKSGLNSGYMLAQYTAASLIAENRVLSHPASVDTADVSAGQEDHASMGFLAGKKLLRGIDNLWYVAAAETLCAAQAVDLAGVTVKLSKSSLKVHNAVRRVVPKLEEDAVVGSQIEAVKAVIRGN
jgi:histidine ammonia-lyase